MSAQDFLVELGTEELPPKALASLGDAFLAGIEKGLQAAGLNYTGKQVYAAPRRLAVLIRQLDVQQPDRSINIDGPPRQAAFDAEGNPTQAALGFAKKCGVDLAEIDQSGAKLRFSQHIPGKATASLLPTIVEDSLNDLPIPKRMHWGASREEFVRPTQWLVMLLGDRSSNAPSWPRKPVANPVATASTTRKTWSSPPRPTTSKTCARPTCWPTSPSVAS